jgi:hypothetical protein
MRILSVGRPLAHPAIDNFDVCAAPAFADYDVVAIDPAGLLATVREVVDGRGEHSTVGGAPVINGPTTTDGIAIADVLHRRLDETTRLLANGGVVVVFGYPQATVPQVAGFTGADRYCFLPAPPGLAWGPPLLQWGEGRSVAVADHAHPFAAYIDAVRDHLLYRAVFDERAPGFAAAAHVFARSGGGAPVGVEFAALGGHIVFLPPPDDSNTSVHGAAIEAAVRALLGRADPDDREPGWLRDQAVPGLAPLLAEAETARDLATRAEERAAAAELAAADLATVRDLLWREGTYALLPAALRCLDAMGFRWLGDERAPLVHAMEGDLLLEVEGSRDAVGMAPHYRLRARLDAILSAEGRAARGLVVVNGQRTQSPERRTAPHLDALRIAAESTRYALLPAPDLFAAARAALAGTDPSTLAAVRTRLVETDGVVSLADLLGEG